MTTYTQEDGTVVSDGFGTYGVTSWVYLMSDGRDRYFKIGFSADPQRRVRELNTGAPLGIEVLWQEPGSVHDEAWLHDYFHARRARGEWFLFDDQDPIRAVEDAWAVLKDVGQGCRKSETRAPQRAVVPGQDRVLPFLQASPWRSSYGLAKRSGVHEHHVMALLDNLPPDLLRQRVEAELRFSSGCGPYTLAEHACVRVSAVISTLKTLYAEGVAYEDEDGRWHHASPYRMRRRWKRAA